MHRLYRLCLLFMMSASVLADGSVALQKPELMLATVYDPHKITHVSDYWVSEKYDGVRAYWDGQQLLTRGGHRVQAPDWFIADFPSYHMDGELWAGRENFEFVSGLVRSHSVDQQWRSVVYMVFDLPASQQPFDTRNQVMQSAIPDLNIPWLKPVPQLKFDTEEKLLDHLNKLVAAGAEGLMLHKGSAYYTTKRTGDLLKLKPTLDSEAIVTGYTAGKGKYKGLVGALEVQWQPEWPGQPGQKGQEVKIFRLGSGLTDELRRNPPAIGSEVTFEYSGLTKNGVPRFARFKRVRIRH